MDEILLSKTINTLRHILTKQGFFEHHLYSTTDYRIQTTESFVLKKNLCLRFNPEPDIWKVGNIYDRFFWIGSLFRKEKHLDKIHRYEFTVIDIYLPHSEAREVVSFFKKILRKLENSLGFKSLSQLPVKYISHAQFNSTIKFSPHPVWYVVTDYPKHESFYDTATKNATKKFEIFFVDHQHNIEVVACGELGDNTNPEMFVREIPAKLPPAIKRKKFVGFGIGLERLLTIYLDKTIKTQWHIITAP